MYSKASEQKFQCFSGFPGAILCHVLKSLLASLWLIVFCFKRAVFIVSRFAGHVIWRSRHIIKREVSCWVIRKQSTKFSLLLSLLTDYQHEIFTEVHNRHTIAGGSWTSTEAMPRVTDYFCRKDAPLRVVTYRRHARNPAFLVEIQWF